MLRVGSFLVLLNLILLGSSSSVVSAEDRGAGNFFEKGFSERVIDGDKPPSAAEEGETLKEAEEAKPSTQEGAKPIVSTPGKGLPVRELGAVVDSRNLTHFHQALTEYRDVLLSTGLPAGEIFVVTGLITRDPADEVAVRKRFTQLVGMGATINFVAEIPEDYKITRSPSWIVQTDQGQIILEGISPLSRHFNSKGEFIDRTKPPQPQL